MGITKGTEYSFTLRDVCGVDFSGGPFSPSNHRYAYAENMYRDYESGDASLIESVVGFRKIASLGGRIHSIFSHKDQKGEEYTVVHAKNKLYRFKTSERDSLSLLNPISDIGDFKSVSFCFGGNLFVLDGSDIIRVSPDGKATKITPDDELVYLPTTYYNGERIEQKNLLTDRFIEKYMIGAAETVIYGSPGLMYRITDENRALCSVVGISSSFSGVLNIPSYTTIGSKRYKVDQIDDNAFLGNNNIYEVRFGVGIYRVGKFAFSNCLMLSAIHAINAPTFIDDYAFKGCMTLSRLSLGAEIEKIGDGIFNDCSMLKSISYASDKKNFSEIENSSSLSDKVIYDFQSDLSLILEIPVYTPTAQIIKVTLDGTQITDYSTVSKGEKESAIVFSVTDKRAVEGKEVIIYAKADLSKDDRADGAHDFLYDYSYESGFDAIRKCRVCECFDGRIFLSANPDLPGVVFYSSRENGKSNALYFGSYDYFSDGLGVFGVSSMLSSADSLLVFKNADDGGGSIFYHTAKETGIDFMPKVYPLSYTHNGIGAIGESFSFFDDPVFISKTGLSAIEKKTISLQRSIACRSHNVNAKLLCERLSEASLGEWCGYLAIGVNGSVYLADSRSLFTHESGWKEYEWFYLTDIGTYENSTRVYRYASSAHAGYEIHSLPDTEPGATVYSEKVGTETVYYTKEDGVKYELYATEELKDGDFHPLVTLCINEDDVFFFGTDNGDLCVFNNDKRGIAPEFIKNSADFSDEEYKKHYARRIHPHFYNFAGHRMRCGVRTAPSDCSLPNLTKTTVKHSLVLKCSLSGNGRIRCEAKTDRSGYSEYAAYPNSAIDFSDLSFSDLTLASEDSVSLAINEKEKKWVDKEIAVYCEDFNSPIGIYSVSYRYTPHGRIKHN